MIHYGSLSIYVLDLVSQKTKYLYIKKRKGYSINVLLEERVLSAALMPFSQLIKKGEKLRGEW